MIKPIEEHWPEERAFVEFVQDLRRSIDGAPAESRQRSRRVLLAVSHPESPSPLPN